MRVAVGSWPAIRLRPAPACWLAVLAARGITVSAEDRLRIEGCNDAATLDEWIARAVTGASLTEVLAPPAASA